MNFFLPIFAFAMTFIGANKLVKGLLANNDIILRDSAIDSNIESIHKVIKKERLIMVTEGFGLAVLGVFALLNIINYLIGFILTIAMIMTTPLIRDVKNL